MGSNVSKNGSENAHGSIVIKKSIDVAQFGVNFRSRRIFFCFFRFKLIFCFCVTFSKITSTLVRGHKTHINSSPFYHLIPISDQFFDSTFFSQQKQQILEIKKSIKNMVRLEMYLEDILKSLFNIPAARSYYTQNDDGILTDANKDEAAFFAPIQALVKTIIDQYYAPHRHLVLNSCFDEILKLFIRYRRDDTFYHPHFVGLSIVFSQVVSNPFRTDNHAKSVEFAIKHLSELFDHVQQNGSQSQKDLFAYLTPQSIKQIALAVENMENFTIPSEFGSNYETDEMYHDTALVYDILQSHLGADQFAFNAYEDALYYEHINIEFDTYVAQRKAQLTAIAKKPQIFFSPLLAREYQKYARENIVDFDGSSISQLYDDEEKEPYLAALKGLDQ